MEANFEAYYIETTRLCRERFLSGNVGDIMALTTEIMDVEGFPMHAPVHHYLVPAVLLTACRQAQGHDIAVLNRDLEVALERARQITGGFCGYYGACGACVGVGIFWSLILDTTPLSKATWAHGNQATGQALLDVSAVGGPRCCKRCTYLSIQSTLAKIQTVLGLELPYIPPICHFDHRNAECLGEGCPYRETALIPITPPTFALPKQTPDHLCLCQLRPVELTHKSGLLFWKKAVGESVHLGETVAELEVEKQILEIPAPATGVLERRQYEEGDTIEGIVRLGYLRRHPTP